MNKNRILMKIVRFLIVLILLLVLAIGFSFLRYRYSKGSPVVIKKVIRYQMVDAGQGDFFRFYFETMIAGNQRVFVENKNDIFECFYVSKEDKKKTWPESPFKMKEKNYTLLLTFETKNLILGGYAPAKILKVERINQKPSLRK